MAGPDDLDATDVWKPQIDQRQIKNQVLLVDKTERAQTFSDQMHAPLLRLAFDRCINLFHKQRVVFHQKKALQTGAFRRAES